MSNTLEINTSDYKFTEFYEWFKNQTPVQSYNESWAKEMRSLYDTIRETKTEDKVTFSDSRLVMIAFLAMTSFDLKEATLREWWIVRRFLELYSESDSIQGTDLLEFVDMYIGFNYTDAEEGEQSIDRIAALVKAIAPFIQNGEIRIPYFVSKNIVTTAKTKKAVLVTGGDEEDEEIEEEIEEEEETIIEQTETEKWESLRDFSEMMLEDATGEEKQKWQDLYDFVTEVALA